MKKRILCNLLVLMMLLSLLPVTALAGGGSQTVWSEDFEGTEPLSGWTIIDANYDGYAFNIGVEMNDTCTSMETFVYSPAGLGENTESGTRADDYLISPVIDLENAYDEYELTYDCRCIQWETSSSEYTRFDVFVVDADTPMTEESLRNLPVMRFAGEWPREENGWITKHYDLTGYAGRQIRLVFHHIDDEGNRLHLDNFEIRDYETDSHIQRIAVLGVPEPEVGLSVKDVSEDGIVICDATNLALKPGSLTYLRTYNESGIPETGDFVDGAEYSVMFELEPREGAFTYSDAIASVNGRQAIVTLKDNDTPEDTSDDIILIHYYYGYLQGKKQTIENGYVNVTPPVQGKTPDISVKPDQDSFEVLSAHWCSVIDHTEGPPMASTEHFEAGKEYRCYFELLPREGYCFPEVAKVRVNGGDWVYSDIPNPDGSFWFHADFTAVENDECTVRFFAGYCKSPASYTGHIGDEFTLPVLANHKDHVFAGWSYNVWGGAEDVISSDFRITKSCTLYAVWLEVLHAPEVRIAAPGVGRSVKDARAVVERYDTSDYSCDEIAPGEEIAWWLDSASVGKLGQRERTMFAAGQTYYGMAYLQADENHCFDESEAGLKLYGAELDEAVAEGQRMKFTFHLTMPVYETVDRAVLFVDTLTAGYPVDETFRIPVYSLTPGLAASVRPGVYPTIDDAYHGTNAWVGGTKPGETYYGAVELTSTVGADIDPEIQVTVIGGRKVGFSVIDDSTYLVLFAFEDQEAYSLEVNVFSEDGGYPCGYLRSDLRAHWTDGFDGPYVQAGEHWLKAAPLPGYVFQEWRIKDGGTLSTGDYYSFTLDDHMDIQAVFGKGHIVTFLNSHGDAPEPQTVADGGLALEPKGLTATDFVFNGWYTDPTCKEAYDFNKPVTGDLILYTGWTYSPGMNTDKTLLNQCIADAEEIDTSFYTDQSVAALHQAIAAAKEVQADPTVSQSTVDGVLDDLTNAVFGLVLKTGGVDFSALDKAIADAEALDTSPYTTESVTALAMVLTGAKMVLSAPGATQADVDAAVENIKSAVAALEMEFQFDDVKDPGKFYYGPVYWAYGYEPQITNGMTPTTFGPDKTCTRGQIVTFLWRAKGCPEPTTTKSPFTDVTGGFYYKAVLWAVENKITNGMTPTTFGPDAGCTRAQVVTFLWRAQGSPEPATTKSPFKDVTGGYYYKAVLWAVENKITNGMTPTTFGPDLTCTRGQIVTFLKRAIEP